MEKGETAVDPNGTRIGEVNEEKRLKRKLILYVVGLEDKANSYPSQLSGETKTTRGDCPCVSQRPRRIAL